jgi:indole-3-acetate monooxygenase
MLGIARSAIDALVELATLKTRGKGKLRDGEPTQVQVAFAEGHLGAARAYLLDMVRDVWKTATESGPITSRQRTLVHLASVHAATLATQAIDMMWDAAGSSAIFTSSPLDRCFRDAHTGRKNIAIYPENYAKFGRMFLGLEA